LPAPGVMVHLSPAFNPPILKGIKVHLNNPFKFDFILDKGDSQLSNDALKGESRKLIKYFLASLTIPEKDLWVNLSPYEKDRIIPNSFGLTEMGRDLLAEDYMLKQITASLIYPEGEVGKKFWKRIYEEAAKKYGTTNIPVNTFNKVWIVAEKAVVYENAKIGAAYVVESKLKVMLEQDYLSLAKHEGIQSLTAGRVDRHSQLLVIPAKATTYSGAPPKAVAGIQNKNGINALGSQVVREIIIPELTKEVNENKNFAQLRQVYNSLILATWYKKKIKDSILEQVYADKNKVAGVNINDPREKEKIFQKYLRAFKKGVFNYIKDDIDPVTQEATPRKYFSGGMLLVPSRAILIMTDQALVADIRPKLGRDFDVQVGIDKTSSIKKTDWAMLQNGNGPQSGQRVKDGGELSEPRTKIDIPDQLAIEALKTFFTFEGFTDDCLMDPDWGYYPTNVKFGDIQSGADFWTYPLLMSPFFGAGVVEQIFRMWQGMKQSGTITDNESFTIVESGAGGGYLARDILAHAKSKAISDGEHSEWAQFYRVLDYKIVERSRKLRKMQRETAHEYLDKLQIVKGDVGNLSEVIPHGPIKGIILENDVLSATAVHKVRLKKDGSAAVAVVIPTLRQNNLIHMREIGLITIEDEKVLLEESSTLQSQFNLPTETGLFYLPKEEYLRLKEKMASLNEPDRYRDLNTRFGFIEGYVNAGNVPVVAQYIRDHAAEIARRLNQSRRSSGFIYVNQKAENYYQHAAQILQAGYVFSIETGFDTGYLIRLGMHLGDNLSFINSASHSQFRTLRAGKNLSEPYDAPGSFDITVDQDFTHLSTVGERNGLKLVYVNHEGKIFSGGSFHFDPDQENVVETVKNTLENGGYQGDPKTMAKELVSSFVFDGGSSLWGGFKIFLMQKEGTDDAYTYPDSENLRGGYVVQNLVLDGAEEQIKKQLLERLSIDGAIKAGDRAMDSEIDKEIFTHYPSKLAQWMDEWRNDPQKGWLYASGIIRGIKAGWLDEEDAKRIVASLKTKTDEDAYTAVLIQVLKKGWQVDFHQATEGLDIEHLSRVKLEEMVIKGHISLNEFLEDGISLDLIIEAAKKAMSMGQRIDVGAVLEKLKPMDADVVELTRLVVRKAYETHQDFNFLSGSQHGSDGYFEHFRFYLDSRKDLRRKFSAIELMRIENGPIPYGKFEQQEHLHAFVKFIESGKLSEKMFQEILENELYLPAKEKLLVLGRALLDYGKESDWTKNIWEEMGLIIKKKEYQGILKRPGYWLAKSLMSLEGGEFYPDRVKRLCEMAKLGNKEAIFAVLVLFAENGRCRRFVFLPVDKDDLEVDGELLEVLLPCLEELLHSMGDGPETRAEAEYFWGGLLRGLSLVVESHKMLMLDQIENWDTQHNGLLFEILAQGFEEFPDKKLEYLLRQANEWYGDRDLDEAAEEEEEEEGPAAIENELFGSGAYVSVKKVTSSSSFPEDLILLVEYLKAAAVPHDFAMSGSTMKARTPHGKQLEEGGIDLSPTNKVLQTQNSGIRIKFHIDQAQLAQWEQAPGVMIGDLTIQPLKSLSGFLGLPDNQSIHQILI